MWYILSMKLLKFIIFLLMFFLFSRASYTDTVKDFLEVRVDIPPSFSLSIETYSFPNKGADLAASSIQSLISSMNTIDLGNLVPRDPNNSMSALISENKVLVKVRCKTNKNIRYMLTQTLNTPLTGRIHGEIFPKSAFACQAEINPDKGLQQGSIYLNNPSSVYPGIPQTIYMSDDATGKNLGNEINIYYWITDIFAEKVLISQRSDVYESSLTLTMIEI